MRSSLGIGRHIHGEVDEDAIQKSISTSSTFRAISKYEEFKIKILELCEDLAERMDRRKVGGQTLTLNMKSTKFEIQAKSLMLNSYIWEKEEL